MLEEIKIIQHNVQAWTYERANELSNYYRKEDADILLHNSTGIIPPKKIKIFTYSTYSKNFANEDHSGIAIAVKSSIRHKVIFHIKMVSG